MTDFRQYKFYDRYNKQDKFGGVSTDFSVIVSQFFKFGDPLMVLHRIFNAGFDAGCLYVGVGKELICENKFTGETYPAIDAAIYWISQNEWCQLSIKNQEILYEQCLCTMVKRTGCAPNVMIIEHDLVDRVIKSLERFTVQDIIKYG